MRLEGDYDVSLSDITLPDMDGYEFMLKLKEVTDPVPFVLMTGFGYDPKHVIVKARQAGLKTVLYKPFRLDKLLSAVETVVSSNPVKETCEG
jgi:CheY-like chemotaxis protein